MLVGSRRQHRISSASSDSSESRLSTRDIRLIVNKLELQKHQSSTRRTYHLVWKKFNEFFIKLDCKPGAWEDCLVLFTAYLVDKGFKSSTIKSYISAIKCVLTEIKVKLDLEQTCITSLTRACKLNNDQITTKLPIQKGLLQLILNEVNKYYNNKNQVYLVILYQTIFITAYYCLFRIGELAKSAHVILAKNVHIALNKKKLLFILETSKTHTRGDKPQLVKISSVPCTTSGNQRKEHLRINYSCPFLSLNTYLSLRPVRITQYEQFFVFSDGSPVLASHLRACLKLMLIRLQLNPRLYSMHSMRTGRSSDLLKYGISVETIKKLGRWKSNAVFRYLRY